MQTPTNSPHVSKKIRTASEEEANKPAIMLHIFTKENCKYCVRAKQLLSDIPYVEVPIPPVTPTPIKEWFNKKNIRTVPQIFINGVLQPGGCANLEAQASEGLNRWIDEQKIFSDDDALREIEDMLKTKDEEEELPV